MKVRAIGLGCVAAMLAVAALAADIWPPPSRAGNARDSNNAGLPPAWAYPVPPPPPARDPNAPARPAPVPDPTPHTVPNSNVTFTRAGISDLYNVPDWHPDDHPPAPEIVLRGRKPGVMACGYCHLPNGQGRPENAGVAGLPAAYIIQQVRDFKTGVRKSAHPDMTPPNMMVGVAKLANDEEVRLAAEYFASLKFKPWIRVVESKTVPKSRIAGAMWVPADGNEMEPIGVRILELPENVAQTELRDSQSGFVAYVPPGSIKKGETIVMTGDLTDKSRGRVTACTVCHGADLRGLGPVPALAGRSPSYIVRQLYDLRHGSRAGVWSPLMTNVVAKLDEADMVAIAAYTASLAP